MVVRGKITNQKLSNIYTTVRNIIKNKECYYTAEEVEQLKIDNKNVFLKGGDIYERR